MRLALISGHNIAPNVCGSLRGPSAAPVGSIRGHHACKAADKYIKIDLSLSVCVPGCNSDPSMAPLKCPPPPACSKSRLIFRNFAVVTSPGTCAACPCFHFPAIPLTASSPKLPASTVSGQLSPFGCVTMIAFCGRGQRPGTFDELDRPMNVAGLLADPPTRASFQVASNMAN